MLPERIQRIDDGQDNVPHEGALISGFEMYLHGDPGRSLSDLRLKHQLLAASFSSERSNIVADSYILAGRSLAMRINPETGEELEADISPYDFINNYYQEGSAMAILVRDRYQATITNPRFAKDFAAIQETPQQ